MKIMDVIVEELNNSLPEGEKVERLHSKPHEIKERKPRSRKMKWSQWGTGGIQRCGISEYNTIIGWLGEIGLEAKECVKHNEKDHALYGRTVHDDNGKLIEIRFYRNTYMNDEELEAISREFPHDTLYVAHK